MNVKAIEKLIKRRPFEPFQIVISSGDRYMVDHPENCLLLKEAVVLAYPTSRKDSLPDDFAILSYLHIASAEPARKHRAR
jgi:hypothetical protein